MWLLPTRGRIGNLRRFLNSARESGCATPGWIIINKDDWDENRIDYENAIRLAPRDWHPKIVEASCYGDALRAVWDDIKNLQWVGLVSDDLVCYTSGWDRELISSLQGWNFASSNDGWQASHDIFQSRMHGATVWSGPLLRAVGWLFPPALKHVFHDDIWETIGRETGCWTMRMEVLVKHLHEALQGVRGPTMDPSSALFQHDKAIFEEWKLTEMQNCLTRVRETMGTHAVRAVKVDFTDLNIMIATPTIDGKYEGTFMGSLFKTFQMIQGNGARCFLAEEKYTADITLARSKIFSMFLRSDSTHLLMIDADMAWTDQAIQRLIVAKKDFVGIAGPKKRYPLQFAANYTDENGNPVPLVFDQESGTMEIGEIGSAFTMITKSCAQRLVAAYPEVVYTGLTGENEYAMFMPLIINRRYYSEDFAFCKRWRLIGGRVFMIPDVPLAHTGSHTFTGAFLSTARPIPERPMQEAAD